MSCKWYARYQRTDRHSSLLLAGRLAVIGEWGDSKRPQPAAATKLKLVNLSRLDNIYWWLQIWKPERGPTDPSSCMINLRSDPRARANHYLDARFYSLGCGCWLLASCERVLGWSGRWSFLARLTGTRAKYCTWKWNESWSSEYKSMISTSSILNLWTRVADPWQRIKWVRRYKVGS